ncbi:MAG: M20/M25/M40 family metallo-hydrolase [Clostridia bacterium]|nr:M20/M25/M40 family metallo-hydrolase [Clostridia bacterium]
MDLTRVFELIDQRRERYYDLLEEVCNLESGSSDFDGVRRVNKALCDFALERGFSVKVVEYENAGACSLISMNDEADQPALLLSGHMDTVYDRGLFGYPPCRREGDILYGPGTSDCKGGILVALLAMDALKSAGYTERPVRLFLQCDEEVGSRYSAGQSIQWMIDEAKRCAAFLNCESGHPGKITLRRCGILKMIIAVHGKAAHAKDYFTGASAVVEAASKILRLHKKGEPGGVSYNCTLDAPKIASNIVPERCDIVIDIRIASMKQAEEASAFVHTVAKECSISGTSGEVIYEDMRPPMEWSERNQALFDKINRICAAHGLPTYEPNFSGGGSDAADVSVAGVPCVDSLGIEGAEYHTINEYCRLSSMEERARMLAAVCVDFDN